MADFDVHLDEENELRFNITTEGTDTTASISTRMVLETSKMDFMFQGTSIPGGEVSVIVPSLKGVLNEGLYNTRLEVLVDDRIFTPLELTANFKQSVKVVAEAIVTRRAAPPSVRANVVRVNSGKKSRPVKKALTETPNSTKINKKNSMKGAGGTRNEELRDLLRRVIKKQG